ncbi:S8 family serine peptidase [Stenotrophomonas sp. MMGLT7]|uniref:S8 family serine peptidase n=1 Tax=Stenotrophomonas sp. MMGLT7 TaxID=2901227 RepID=UPI001E57F881|nr:S8 family serine peptidase [Stenotrophomonas sp. MMGLT7]MCD7100019.1 S8 family serine peptidase [Stenotrophomonas sp. MMGLT7]
MKKSKISLAVAGIVLGLSAAAGVNAANEAAPRIVDNIRSQPAPATGDRLIVTYASPGTQNSIRSNAIEGAARRAGLAQPAAAGRAGTALAVQRLRKTALGGDVVRLSRKVSQTELDALVAELKADPAVSSVEVDRILRHNDFAAPAALATPAAVTPNDTYYAQYQWHFKAPSVAPGGVNAPDAWEISSGDGVVVAVLDTGILRDHPDFAGTTVLEGYDFISDAEVSGRDSDNRVPGGDDPGDWDDTEDSSWHGTHVAGTVAETTNNSLGGAGLAYNASLLPVRVLGHGGGYTSDIADAIVWASGGPAYDIDDTPLPANQNPAEVINLSLGGAGACGSYLQSAIDTAVGNGSTIVVAAGNSNADVANYSPAGCDNVIAVGSNRITGGRAWYSNYGAKVDIAAPGGGGSDDTGNGGWDGYVFQAASNAATTPESGSYNYAGYAGTSQAAPHVAGTVALVQSALVAADKDPLTPAQVETLLKQSARAFPVTIPSTTPIGAGIVDAKAALDLALQEPGEGPVATPLVNKATVTGLAGASGSETLYSFQAEAGKVLSFLTFGGSGDVSVYVSFGAEPSTSTADARSTRQGNSETVRFTAPQAGTYYVKLVGASSYSGVSLTVRQ